jgi:hypothetical protein
MTWVAQVHNKAQILLAQIENARKLATDAGLDAEAITREMYRRVDALYETEFPLARAIEGSDLLFHIEGRALRDHTPRLSLVESLFSNIRQQVFNVAKAVAQFGDDATITDRDVELSLSALAPGSLYVGIKAEPPERRDGQQNILGANDRVVLATREAMRSIGVISRHLDDESDEVRASVPDPKVRDAALVAVARLAPSGRSGIDRVTISSKSSQGALVGAPLTPKLRKELRYQLREVKMPSFGVAYVQLRGEVRELDLDFQRFELRRIDTAPHASVRCQLAAHAGVDLTQLAGRRVEVAGTGDGSAGGAPRMLRVDRVTPLDGPGWPQAGSLMLPGPG